MDRSVSRGGLSRIGEYLTDWVIVVVIASWVIVTYLETLDTWRDKTE